jgi:flagellar basal-body rod protein FlgG
MLEGLNVAAAGMAAQQQRLDAVANDLANANTTGYKHVRVGFRDLVCTQAGRSSAVGPRTRSRRAPSRA